MLDIVVVSPHRDDSAFSLGLNIAAWRNDGHRVHIINCFTRSDYAPYLLSSDTSKRASQVSAIRKEEDDAWRRHYTEKIEITDLDLDDAPLRLGCSYEAVCDVKPSTDDNSGSYIQSALRELNFDALVLPLAIGRHVDHLTARNAALFLVGEELPCAFYEDLPYAARAENTIEQTTRDIKIPLYPVFACVAVSADASVKRKWQLARTYSSQIDDEAAWQIARFSQRYEGRERLWANSTWRSSALRGEDGAAAGTPA